MGNKIMSTRAFVDEKYTRPQGLYDTKDADYRKLRRLILNGQLAPCFPGVEEYTSELDECPICFLFYPSLNRSRCCSKAICTECYLQIKSAHFARSVQCPFCKTSSYTVEFRGAKTAEEKGVEQAEEQRVIEAKIRIRQKELHDEAERVTRLVEDTQAEPFEHEGNNTLMEPGMSAQAAHMQGSLPGLNRTEGFDLDIEDMMLMEAISLSIKEQGPMHQEFDLAQQIPTITNTRFSGRTRRFRRAIRERQATSAEIRGGDQVVNTSQNLLESDRSLIANHDLATRSCTIDPLRRGFDANRALQKEKEDDLWETWQDGEQCFQNASHGSEEVNGWLDDSKGNSFWSSVQREGREFTFGLDQGLDQSSSEAVEAGTSFSPSASELLWEAPDFDSFQSSDNIAGETSLSSASASTLPVKFEDQIMLAMALSLAEAQTQAWKH